MKCDMVSLLLVTLKGTLKGLEATPGPSVDTPIYIKSYYKLLAI